MTSIMLKGFQLYSPTYISPTSHVLSLAEGFEMEWWQIAVLVIGALALVPGIVLIIGVIVVYCCKKGELHTL